MKKLAVIHYMPLEFYPPVINFLDYISSEKNIVVHVFTTKNNKKRKEYYNYKLDRINRTSFPNPGESGFKRLKKYLQFNFSCFLSLLKLNPSEIIYYESYSAGPVYWYLRLFGKNKKLKIHYHEYSSPEWYDNGMRLVKIYHKYEKEFLYKKADWISHTNRERINLFLNDHPEVEFEKMKVLPNYPPESWRTDRPYVVNGGDVLKTVYVGSLSLEATYIKEYCDWVIQQKGQVSFDVYSYNLHEDTKFYLEHLECPHIRFINGGIEYKGVPDILYNYDVGIIFYKDYSANVRYCAPNKLFEYMACGLEVWFSENMKGCHPYKRSESPQILSVDFLSLNSEFLLNSERCGTVKMKQTEYTAEQALSPLIKELTN